MRILCHSTVVGNLASIEKEGLLPMVGEATKESEVFDTDEKAVPMVFMAEHPASLPWQVARHLGVEISDLTPDDIREKGLLCIVEAGPDIYLKMDGVILGPDGDEALVAAGLPIKDLPAYIEDCDFFSLVPVRPAEVLTGQDLMDRLVRDYADFLPAHVLDGAGYSIK